MEPSAQISKDETGFSFGAGAWFATTAKGMEPLLVDELRALGAVSVEERRAGAAFRGPLELAYRACLWSRVANRVLLPLAEFPSENEEALYEGVRAIAWEDHLGPDRTLAVDFSTSGSAISHSHYGALKTKDAIVDRLRELRGARPSVDTLHPDLRVNVYLNRDQAIVSIDLSGDSLHRRGYREEAAPAPLKENLAAAILLLADWPRLARLGTPFLDPMCGSGTLPIEAALIAADRAPGLDRARYGFFGWSGHDAAIWTALVDEARARELTDPKRFPTIVGYDADPRAVKTALANVERARLRGCVHIERRDFQTVEPLPVAERAAKVGDANAASAGSDGKDDPNGLLVMNPPYGERLGEAAELRPLYESIGNVLRRRFTGWTGQVFTGNADLGRSIGLKATRRRVLYNGAIECRLLEFPISTKKVNVEAEGPGWRHVAGTGPGAEMFENRLTKNLRHLRKWAKREGVYCYRLYDADLPEYAVAVDLYEDAVHVQEYEPPATVDAKKAEERLQDVVALVPKVLGLPPERVHLKVRRRQRGLTQYEKLAEERRFRVVREGALRFRVNLEDYLDTGLFLDHRQIRAMIGELASGRRFLNLFCYTGTATVHAAAGGALSTTSVDLSNTYLEWAARNMDLNGHRGPEHLRIHADCLKWLPLQKKPYGLIFVAPPTFTRSKSMSDTFEVQRDHVSLLRAAGELLEPDGVMLFSTHFRRFQLDTEALPELRAEEITKNTVPLDFARDARTHRAFRIVRA